MVIKVRGALSALWIHQVPEIDEWTSAFLNLKSVSQCHPRKLEHADSNRRPCDHVLSKWCAFLASVRESIARRIAGHKPCTHLLQSYCGPIADAWNILPTARRGCSVMMEYYYGWLRMLELVLYGFVYVDSVLWWSITSDDCAMVLHA